MNSNDFKMDGYYTYQDLDMVNYIQYIWYIPKELHNSEKVKNRMSHKLFKELIKCMNGIDSYNTVLKQLVLDSDKEQLLNKKQKLKWKCHQILNEVNDELSPYHWEIQKTQDDYRRECYLIGLFTGENRMANKIDKM